MSQTDPRKWWPSVRVVLIGVALVLLAAGITHAAMRTIQLNAAATFPVDI